MSKSAWGVTVLAVLLAILVLSPAIISARATPTSYVPGVTPGQWAKYKVLYDSCSASDPTYCATSGPKGLDVDYGLLQIETVSGSTVTLSLLSVYKNGTSSHTGIMADVSSGTINGTGLGGSSSADYFVLATGLTATDPIWKTSVNPAPTLNTTKTATVVGSPRTVNDLNYSLSYTSMFGSFSSATGYSFDQASGLFVEIAVSFSSTLPTGSSEFAFAIGMIDNNIWHASYLPDYGLNANPTTLSITGTATGTASITPSRLYAFSAKIDLKATASASGVTCSLSPNTLDKSLSDSSTLSCSGSPGSYTVTVQGNGSYLIRTVAVSVNIVSSSNSNPDFQISSSGGINFQTGGSGTSTITITAQNGYSAATNLEISSTPSGLTCNLSKNTVSGYGTSTLTCSGPPGTYTVTVKATGGGTTHSTQTTVTVNSAATPTQPASSLPMSYVYAGVGIAAAAAAGVLGFLFLRKKPGEAGAATSDATATATQA
ncbi:MAG TPA: hypothetical protein VGS11_07260 [Candidatus Bathyarchaeia archaeon]|nr:hypothetical protein [Candidatus Bathyarchaeia archaeon]